MRLLRQEGEKAQKQGRLESRRVQVCLEQCFAVQRVARVNLWEREQKEQNCQRSLPEDLASRVLQACHWEPVYL